jgi:hypothetical protein
MKMRWTILSLLAAALISPHYSGARPITTPLAFDFYGNTVQLSWDNSMAVSFGDQLTEEKIQSFVAALEQSSSAAFVNDLLSYKEKLQSDDWLYYQLIRKTAQQISPKAVNYYRYTLYKWFLLTRSGYDATLKIGGDKLLFYVQTNENIYNIPAYIHNGKQYVCLNYHDYGNHIDFDKEKFTEIPLVVAGAKKPFSYKITRLPDFRQQEYQEKALQFSYYQNDYRFYIKLNPQVKTIFANYPVVDYESYFNIPLSRETYSSLIPLLKKHTNRMSTKKGVDYLMRFTRYAFPFENDAAVFGSEKRLSPEQTLLYEQSDCEDRAALFFYLVKEIYDLPMIVLSFPEHVTVAVQFDKPAGHPILYNGKKYYVCEPTPQKQDLKIGQLLPDLSRKNYEVVYAYQPRN